jgi:hypothetical protein
MQQDLVQQQQQKQMMQQSHRMHTAASTPRPCTCNHISCMHTAALVFKCSFVYQSTASATILTQTQFSKHLCRSSSTLSMLKQNAHKGQALHVHSTHHKSALKDISVRTAS